MSFNNLLSDLEKIQAIECDTQEQFEWIKGAACKKNIRLRVPLELAVRDLRRFDIVDIYSPQFTWGKFQGKISLVPLLCNDQDLTLLSYGKTDYTSCILLDSDTKLSLSVEPLQHEYILYAGGRCEFITGFEETTLWTSLIWKNIRNVNHIISEYNLPVWDMKQNTEYKCGTRLCASLSEAMATYSDFILENYTGRIIKDDKNYLAVEDNILYSKKAKITFLDVNMRRIFVFRPLIGLKDKVMTSDLWSITY